MKLVQRWDTAFASTSSYERTPQGGIRAKGTFSRSGVLEYEQPDGSIIREWIPPEELFRPESYKTLCDAPITVHHPQGGEVQSHTYQRITVGHVSNDVAPEDGEFLSGTAVIQDESTVDLALEGGLSEFSPGYLSALEMTPGVVPDGYPDAGKPYDRVQRNRKYNHMAFLPPGMGRSGPSVSLRLDSLGNQIGPEKESNHMELTPEEIEQLRNLAAAAPKLIAMAGAPAPAPAAPPAPAPPPPQSPPVAANTDTADGSNEAALVDDREKRMDSSKEKDREDTVAPAKPLSREEQERIVNDSIELRDSARRVLGEQYDFRRVTNQQVMVDVVKHVDSKFELGSRSHDYLLGRFESALEQHAEQQKRESEGLSDHAFLRQPRNDSASSGDFLRDIWSGKKSAEA